MPLTEKLKKEARLFVIKWNTDNPIDSHWRRTFNIPFGSPQHLSVDFIDQQVWFEEAELMRQLKEYPDASIDEDGRVIIPQDDDNNFGMTDEEIEREFDSMDLAELNEKHGKRQSDDNN